MAEEGKIIPEDLISADVIKRFNDLNTKLIEVLGTMSNLSKTAIQLDQSLKAQGLSADQLSKSTNQVNVTKQKLTEAEKEAIKIEQLQQKIIDSEKNSIEQLNAKNKLLTLERNKLSTTTKDGQKEIDKHNKLLDQNTKTIKDNSSAAEKQRMNIGNYKSALTDLVPGVGGFIGGLQGMTKAALAFIATPLGLILLAIVVVVKAVTAAFHNSEEGQNKFAKISAAVGAILQGLTNILAKVGNVIIDAFTKPKEAIEWFKQAMEDVKNFFSETFGKIIVGLVEGAAARMGKAFAFIGLAWQKVKGWFIDNEEGIKKANAAIDEYAKKAEEADNKRREGWNNLKDDVKNGIDTIKNAGAEFIAEEARLAALGARYADMQAKIRKDERRDLIENSKLSIKSAKDRADAEAMKKTNVEQSIVLATEAMKLDEKILTNDLKIAKEKLAAQKFKGQYAKQDIEYLDELAKLTADVNNKEAAVDELKRGSLRQLNRLRMEAFSQEKDRLKTELDADKNVLETQISYNQALIDNENTSYEKRLSLVMQNASTKIDIAEKETESAISEVNKQMELKLLSEKDGAAQLEKLEKDKNKKIFDADLALDKDIKSIQTKRLSDMDRMAQEEINIQTDKYLAGEMTIEQLADKSLDIQIKMAEAELELANLTVDQKIALEEKLNNLKIQLLDKEKAKREEIYKAGIDLANAYFDYNSQLRENELTELETQKQYRLDLAGDDARQRERIEKEFAKKSTDIKRRQAQADKNQAIFNAVINTAQAVVKALNNPWPLNLVLAALMAGLGAVQIATISSKPLPKYAKGIHRGFTGGVVEVGEAGYEAVKLPSGQVFLTPDKATKMVLPKGAEIFTHNETKQMLEGGATVEKWDELISEQKKTRKALAEQPKNSLNITPGGWKATHQKTNSVITYIDRYFRI
jgi:hypothetical protein